jgi:ABC-type branched-subunit amino acid transport system substrate-binding protein
MQRVLHAQPLFSRMFHEEVQLMLTQKKLFACVGLIVVCVMMLSACASNSPGGATSSPTGGTVLKVGPGVDVANKTITLGIISPYSGIVAAPIGVPLADGVKVFFDHVNDNGGINGYKVKFLEEDSKYDPQLQVQLYNQIHNQVLMIADSLGTPTTEAIIPFANQDHMLISAATLASSLARQQYLILVGTPYRLQVENAFDYVVNTLGKKNPATGIIYQNDEYGQDGLTGYKESIAAYGLNDVAQASYATTDTDFTAQVSLMKKNGAKYVFLSTLPSVTAAIVGTAYKLGYNPQFILQSPAWANVLLTAVPALAPLFSKLWLVGQGAIWGDTSKPGMAQLLQDVAKYAPSQKPDGYFEFGYTESEITYAILKKAMANNDITRDGLFNAFNSLGSVDLGGLYPSVTYGASPNQRVPTRDSVVYQIDPTMPNDVRPLTADFTGSAAQVSNF